MTRSPLFYAMGRGMDMDAGGAAELQTDVMRFMAILSLCLVAIFALVQSLPVAEKPAIPVETVAAPEPEAETVAELAQEMAAQTGTVTVEMGTDTKPEAQMGTVTFELGADTKPEVTVPNSKVTVPNSEPIAPAKTSPTTTTPEKIGFTLQFESDDALTRLVSRHDVGLYVIAADKSMRLQIDGQRLNFWPASLPAQYHEMDSSTVPVEVRRALLRSGTDTTVNAKWGVTLPPGTASQLQQFLASASGGSLIIGGNGELRLDP